MSSKRKWGALLLPGVIASMWIAIGVLMILSQHRARGAAVIAIAAGAFLVGAAMAALECL